MEAVEALLKTDNVALLMGLAWILYLMKELKASREETTQERQKNAALIELNKDVIQNGLRGIASGLRQIKRLLEGRHADETGEFNASDFSRD